MENIFNHIIEYKTDGRNNHYEIFPTTIEDFFGSSKYFRVPDYQRPYSWEKSNILALFEDINDSIKKKKGWFLGPIFTTIARDGKTIEREILDGQQRLTTIQLILREAYVIEFSFTNPLELDKNNLKKFSVLKDRIKSCFLNIVSGEYESKFISDQSVRELLSEYISKAADISTFSEYESVYKKFKEGLKNDDWSETVRTVKLAVSSIQEYLRIMIGSNPGQTWDQEKFDYFIVFINKLLKDFWLIEIPLKKEGFILDIFESINNRGKPLTLVDILRFKSLTLCEDKIRLEIQSKWTGIFKQLQKLTNIGVIKDEDDFFKVVLNTYSKESNGITSKDNFIKLFLQDFGSSDKILQFLFDVKNICELLIYVNTPVDSNNKLIELFPNGSIRDNAKCVLQLLKMAVNCSDNARYLVFYMGRNMTITESNKLRIIDFSFYIVKAVLYLDIYAGAKSNEVRIKFLDVIQNIDDTQSQVSFDNFLEMFEWNILSDSSFDNNLMHSTNSDYSILLLAFYQFFNEKGPLMNNSSEQYGNTNCEHMFPVKWIENWSKKEYSEGDLKKSLDKLSKKSHEFPNVDFDQFVNKIHSLTTKILLKRYIDKENIKQENSLIEFIGNKWILFYKTNISASHKSFEDKKSTILKKGTTLTIPNNSNKIGLEKYDNFDYNDILHRTLVLISDIKENFQNDWK